MKNTKEANLECSCGTDIGDDGGGGFLHLLRVMLHLQGSPHNMGRPEVWKSTDSSEVFTDHLNANHRVVLRRDD